MTTDCPRHTPGFPAVTAIVSTYNSERFMRGCLEDLTGQTLFSRGELEIVVVDSASPQNEAAIVREFQARFGKSIVYIRTEARETVYQAWNRAIQASAGRYITNANTDDRHRSDALEVMACLLDSNPAIDLVYADVLITRTPNETFDHNSATGRHEWFSWNRNTLLGVGCFIGPQPMWRRSLHDLYGMFDTGLVTSGDYEFWLRISQTSAFHHIPEPLGLYLEHDESIEHANEGLKLSENSRILDEYRQAADEGRIIRCAVFEQLRDAVGLEKNLNTLMINMMKVDALASAGKPVPEELLQAYRQAESGMFAMPLPIGHVEEYIRAAEALLLSSREWYGSYRREGLPGTVITLVRDQLVDKALQEARQEARRGRIDRAVDIILKQAISIHSQSPAPYVELAEILVAAGRHEDALEVLPEAPEDTDRIWMCEIAAVCHAALGEEKQALAAAETVLQQKGERARPLEVLGTLAARRGEMQAAEGYFRRSAAADPARGEALLSLGMLSWSRGDLEEAYRFLRRSVELSPLNAGAPALLHDAARRLGCIADFIELTSSLLESFPDALNLVTEQSSALAECGRAPEALEFLERAIVLIGPDNGLLDRGLELRHQAGAHDGSVNSGRPTVSLCMIVRDEATVLPRCLASARPFVDEIVVVDTGSVDRTAEIAELFGAQVSSFQWVNDFSAARNHALGQATCQWILVLDADEALWSGDLQLFRETLRNSAGRHTAWSVTTKNYNNRPECEGWKANDGACGEMEQGDGWYPSRKVRLFPNAASIRFQGDIHEMVEPDLRKQGIPIEQAPFVVHHYGELTDSDRRTKQMRYYRMGMAKLADNPDDPAAMMELALQAGELELFDEALELWDRLLERGISTRDVHFNRGYVLIRQHRYAEALLSTEKALEFDPEHKESQLNAAISELHTGQCDKAWQRVVSLSDKYRDWPLLIALRLALSIVSDEKSLVADCHAALRRLGYGIDAYLRDIQNTLIESGHPVLAGKLAVWVKEAGYGSGK